LHGAVGPYGFDISTVFWIASHRVLDNSTGKRVMLGAFIMNEDTATEEQFIDFKCPCCGEDISFPASAAKSVQECFGCTEAIIVPESGSEGRKIPLPVASANLTLRKFRGADWKDLLQLFSDDDFFAAAPFKLDGEERISRWLEEDAIIKLTTPGVPFTLAVQAQEGGKVIGLLTLNFTDAARLQAILHIVLHRDFQRRGFGAEAAAGALRFCFEGIFLHRVMGYCDSTNAAACRMFETAGMRREGEFVRDHKVGEEWANTVAYAILREEFKPAAAQ
jgi:RimJ/RimL family protein N-acetyltransferase